MKLGEHTTTDAAALAREFDATFAAAPVEPVVTVDLLAIRVGSHAVALRVAELSSLHRVSKLVPVPGTPKDLLGVAAIRGRVVPVYDLGALLGHEAGGAAHWLAVTGTPVVALAFATFERQLRVAEASVVATIDRSVRAIATVDGTRRPVLDLRALHAEIVRASRTRGPRA